MSDGGGSGIQFPLMRANLVSAIEFLANSTTEFKHMRHDEQGTLVSYIDLDMAIHILFDDIDELGVNPQGQIGFTLATEADAMTSVMNALDCVLEVDCPDDLDEDNVKTPLWLDIVNASREALRIMDRTLPIV